MGRFSCGTSLARWQPALGREASCQSERVLQHLKQNLWCRLVEGGGAKRCLPTIQGASQEHDVPSRQGAAYHAGTTSARKVGRRGGPGMLAEGSPTRAACCTSAPYSATRCRASRRSVVSSGLSSSCRQEGREGGRVRSQQENHGCTSMACMAAQQCHGCGLSQSCRPQVHCSHDFMLRRRAHQVDEVEAGHERGRQLDVLHHRQRGVVARAHRVGARKHCEERGRGAARP